MVSGVLSAERTKNHTKWSFTDTFVLFTVILKNNLKKVCPCGRFAPIFVLEIKTNKNTKP